MKKVRVKTGQTAWDIALQEFGNASGFFWLVDDNPQIFVDLDIVLQEGAELFVREQLINKEIYKYYTKNKINPANAVSSDELSNLGITVNGSFNQGFDEGFLIGEGELFGAFDEGFDQGYEIMA